MARRTNNKGKAALGLAAAGLIGLIAIKNWGAISTITGAFNSKITNSLNNTAQKYTPSSTVTPADASDGGGSNVG